MQRLQGIIWRPFLSPLSIIVFERLIYAASANVSVMNRPCFFCFINRRSALVGFFRIQNSLPESCCKMSNKFELSSRMEILPKRTCSNSIAVVALLSCMDLLQCRVCRHERNEASDDSDLLGIGTQHTSRLAKTSYCDRAMLDASYLGRPSELSRSPRGWTCRAELSFNN